MHNFTPEEVADPGFDVENLKLSSDDIKVLRAKISPKNQRDEYSEILYSKISDQEMLSIIFVNGLMEQLFPNNVRDNKYSGPGLYAISQLLERRDIHRLLSEKIYASSPHDSLISHFYSNHWFRNEFLIEQLKKGGPSNLREKNDKIIKFLLSLISPEQAYEFLSSEYEDVRLAAYEKLGILKNIEKMLLDKAAIVRQAAVLAMDTGDPRFSLLLKEKTKTVLIQLLLKCEISLLPMLIGNKNIFSDNYLKDLFNKRMENR